MAVDLKALRAYVVSLQMRGSPYSATSQAGMLELIDELEAARAVVEAGRLLPLMLIQPAYALSGRELLFQEALAEYDKAVGRGGET